MLRLNLTVSRWIVLGGLYVCFLAACSQSQGAPTTLQSTPEKASTPTIRILTPQLTKTPEPQLSKTPTPKAVSTVDLRGQLVQFWYVRETDVEDLIPKMVEDFNKTNQWRMRVESVPFDSSGVMDESLSSAAEAQKLPAALAGYSHDLRYWNSEGISLTDLQAYLDDPAWGLSTSDQLDFYPVMWAQDVQLLNGKDMGTRFGLPWYKTGLVMLYNQGWAKELGFNTPPTTPAQFRQQACAAAKANREDDEKGNDGTGGFCVHQGTSMCK